MNDELRALFELFEGLPRAGPGSDEATREALGRLPALPAAPRVLDLGCGPGRQTLVLAEELGTTIEAVDLHRPFLDQLERAAAERGLSERVRGREGDMGALDLPPESVDLIWSEGAIYILGFAAGLERWRRHLRPEGLAVVSEASWFVAEPPPAAREFWARCYPQLGGEEENRARAEGAGYRLLDRFRLPREVWWSSYYEPLSARIADLRRRGVRDPALLAVIDESEEEMEVFRRYGHSFGYTFYLLQRTE